MTNDKVSELDPNHNIFIAFKGGGTLGPLPTTLSTARTLLQNYRLFLEGKSQTIFEYATSHSNITVDFKNVEGITTAARGF